MNPLSSTTRKIFKGHSWLAAASALAMLMGTGCGKPKKPVARVGDEWIGQPQWQAYLNTHQGQFPPTALDGLVRRELAWEQAQRKGLLQGQEWEEFRKRNRISILVKAYLDAQAGPMQLGEPQAREMFMDRGQERHVAHVLCKTREEADSARERLHKGEAIGKIAVALSKDPSVASNRGDLGWIKRDGVVLPFAEAVFAIKAGETCGPFETEFGWHVAKVLEVRQPAEEEFTKNKARIMGEMQETANAMRRPGILRALKTEYPLTADKAVLGLDRTTVPAPGDEARMAGKVAGTSISLKELKQFMGDALNVTGSSHGLGPETKGKFMELLADDLRIAAAAEKSHYEKRPEVQAMIWDTERQATLGAFTKTYLIAYKVSESDLKGHYERFPDRFRGIGAVRLNLLVTDQPSYLDRAAQDAMKGVPWKNLVEKYANKDSTGTWDTGWVEVDKLSKVLPKDAIQAMLTKPLESLIGPVSGPEGLMLFKLLERRAGTILPLQDCGESVRLDYLKEHGADLVNKYLDSEGRTGIRIERFPENLALPAGH